MKKLLILLLTVVLLAGCGKGKPAKELVSEENAKGLVLTILQGATEKDIKKFTKDFDDGKYEYDVEVIYNNMEYEFEINAETGEIISWESEPARK